MEEKELEKILKGVVKSGKYVLGLREVLDSVTGSKIVIASNSVSLEEFTKLSEACNSASVPLHRYGGTSVGLGRLCGKSFRVTALAVKSPGETDLSRLLAEVAPVGPPGPGP